MTRRAVRWLLLAARYLSRDPWLHNVLSSALDVTR